MWGLEKEISLDFFRVEKGKAISSDKLLSKVTSISGYSDLTIS
jgi:hypothetical protein